MFLTKKKHKMNSLNRIFQEKWTDEDFCVSINGKALCLICSESITVLKQYNPGRYHDSKHTEKYKNCVGTKWRESGGFKNGGGGGGGGQKVKKKN
jgi:hypothetical protein